ncbi:erythromycin esterase family protein [Lentzea nigeriaca]|uniref:erythromycin esterase family protein n=1 Tax=Lentzea nigeriaca TaxID=1128665 RepID=UPI00195E071C|nr:erythromycin esterase family protein [Lentzea nigeriaca]MBM7856373.1 erythromycin esterase [Lentzea nigeriaca]
MDVHTWLTDTAIPLPSTDAEAAAELGPLGALIGDAVVVGIGPSTYGAHEQFTLTAAVIRYLVEHHGFRTVATEEDWDVALALDNYVVRGEGDLDDLLATTGMPWRTGETRELLEWLRDYNTTQADPVRFVGVGVIDTRAEVYDLVSAHVGNVATEELPALLRHFAQIRPIRPDHVRWFFTEAPDREALVEHARAALAIVERVAKADLVVQHARQIVAFYEHYTHHVVEDGYRDEKMAENLRWWHDHTGHRIAYWSTNAHSVRSERLTISIPPKGKLEFTPTGAHLAKAFGDRYFSLGLTFTEGEVISGWGLPPFGRRPVSAPRQPGDFAETPLSAVDLPQFLVGLRGGPGSWLDEPAKARVIGSIYDPGQPPEEYWMTGGSLADWFDALIHTRTVTPTTDL